MAGLAVFLVPFGIAFGVAAVERGISLAQTLTMSVLVFSAAAQFAALQLWETGTLVSLLLVVLAISTRHILLGAALSPWLNQISRPKRLASLAVLSDPNFADSSAAFDRDERDIGRLVGGGAASWLSWVAGTAIGAIAGKQFGDLDRFDIDVLMASYFAAMLLAGWLERWQGHRTVLPAAAAAGVALVGLYVLPAGWNIVAAALAGGAVGGIVY
ncbi:MAG: branched-chain amino acid ABC transporter permease [Rhizobiales bacterium]|nr:branched-chain amino acid ABC transporter permease [Hyphomicrobiales bacterium]